MDKTTIYFKDGTFVEYSNHDNHNFVSMVSGNHLIVTTKTTENNGDESFVVSNTTIYDLSNVKNFVKITPTKKFNIEENVSDK
jgi:hypothetical protein